MRRMRFRAAVVVLGLVAACGDGIAPPDATMPVDGPAGRVTVRYLGGDQAPTLRVLFQNADSSLVLATRTGIDGTANAFMAPGGFVTVIQDGSFNSQLYTWADVQPGDELAFGSELGPTDAPIPSFRLRVPFDPEQGFYQVATSCGSSPIENPGGESQVTLTSSCRASQDLLVTSLDRASFTRLRYLFARDVQLDASPIDLPGPWHEADAARVEVTNVPGGMHFLNVQMSLVDDGRAVGLSERGGTFEIIDGAGALDFGMSLPPGIDTLVSITPTFQPELLSTVRAVRWGTAQPTTRVDFGQLALRPYHEFPTYLRSQHAIRWSEEGDGAPADAVVAQFSFRGVDLLEKHWTIIAPGTDETTVRYPRLPVPELMPGPDADVFQPSTLTTIRLDGGGYARVKRSLPITWGSGLPWPIDADQGTVLIQELGSPQFPTD